MRELIKKLTPKPLIECYKSIRYLWITLLFYVFRLFPIKKNRVVFVNVWGFGDNAKYVALQLADRKPKADIAFICNHPKAVQYSFGIRMLKTNSIKAIFQLATAKVWIGSNRMEGYIRKRKDQYYIQLWHGGLALKKIEGDCATYLGPKYIKYAKQDSAMTDLYVSNGSFCTDMYRRAFWFKKEILECGSPRMDALIQKDPKQINHIKQELNIPLDKKIVLYGPTYRDTIDVSIYHLNIKKLVQSLQSGLNGEWVVIIRLHPLVQKLSTQLDLPKEVIDASSYKDMYELMLISDVLITDYSNIMFEFALTKQPVFLYAKDSIVYAHERGLYFDYQSLPFPIAAEEEMLYEQISNYQSKDYMEKQERFFHEVGIKESGTAAKTVASRISQIIK